jgi:hypothetical protein
MHFMELLSTTRGAWTKVIALVHLALVIAAGDAKKNSTVAIKNGIVLLISEESSSHLPLDLLWLRSLFDLWL